MNAVKWYDEEKNKWLTEREIEELAKEYMCIWGTNINIFRAIPDVRDGCKPVIRRMLYSTWLNYGNKYFKVASATGDVLHLSPHGDASVNDAFNRLAQTFNNNICLYDATGNAGTLLRGDDGAAPRYLTMKLSKFAHDVFFTDFDGRVDMKPSYDDTMEEPIILPARFPVILLNGTQGVGYTVATGIPPYNLNEIADATIKLIENPDANIRLIPDSPTGCDIMINEKDDESFAWYATAKCDTENYTITFTHLPYQVFLNDIDNKLREIMKGDKYKPIPDIISVSQDSDMMQDKVAYTVICKPKCNIYNVLATLYKRVAGLRSSFRSGNMLVVDTHGKFNKIYRYNTKEILISWINNRRITKMRFLQRTYAFKLIEISYLKGKAFMLSKENLDKTIKVVREAKPATTENIIAGLVSAYDGKVTSAQAKIVADLRLANISLEEHDKTLEKIDALTKEAEDILTIIQTPDMLDKVIIEELREIKKNYGYPRRSKILKDGTMDFSSNNVGAVHILKDGSFIFTEDEDGSHMSSDVFMTYNKSVILIDNTGHFVKVTNLGEYPLNSPMTMSNIARHTNGKCISVIVQDDSDVLVLTNKGILKRASSNIFKVSSAKSVIPLEDDENIVSILEVSPDSLDDLLIYTDDGMGKRIQLSKIHRFSSLAANGIKIIPDTNNVAGMFLVNNNKPYVLYVTKNSKVRKNRIKFLTVDKKNDELKRIIPLDDDKLLNVFCCNDTSTIELYHANGETTEIKVADLQCTTMGVPAVRTKETPSSVSIRAVLKG